MSLFVCQEIVQNGSCYLFYMILYASIRRFSGLYKDSSKKTAFISLKSGDKFHLYPAVFFVSDITLLLKMYEIMFDK